MVEDNGKNLADFSTEERYDLLKQLYEVFKKHGVEKQLEAPKYLDQLVTDLTSKKFDRHHHMVVEGQLKADQADLAKDITKDIEEVLKDVSSGDKQVEICAKIGVGDMVQDIEEAGDVFGDGNKTIQHKEGEVILYDLWATWCPPCQAPMAHNQEMLTKNKEKWGANVRIIGLSIDDNSSVVKSHVENKNWQAIEHYHVDNGKCTASATYGSGGVPHVFLVDKKGKIVFMGHPASRNLEQDINDLLEDKAITGEGTGPSTSDEDSSKAAGDQTKITEAIAKFQTDAQALIQKEEVKKIEGLMRGFLVLVDTVEAKENGVVHKPVCHTQLIGTQAGIDAMAKLCDEINKGPWENKDMKRAVSN